MSREGNEQALAFLQGQGSATQLEKIVSEHADGSRLIEPTNLAAHYRRVILSSPAGDLSRYHSLATKLARWVQADLDTKFRALTKAGRVETLVLATAKTQYSREQYRPVAISEVQAKLPSVVEKIARGDLTRFVNLITASQVYGVCIGCSGLVAFGMLHRGVELRGMAITFQPQGAGLELVVKWLTEGGTPATWLPIAGMCNRPSCVPACANCGTNMPVAVDKHWLVSRREDGLCPPCAARMLINIKRPKLKFRDQRKLGRLIIS